MFRFIVTALIAIALISFVRSVIGIIMKFLTGGTKSAGESARTASGPKGAGSAGGTLRRCPTCGTYTSESIAIKRIQDGNTIFYCSTECEQKAQTGV